VAPAASALTATPKPKIAKNGRAANTRSPGSISTASPVRTAVSTIARCDRRTPFGLPIVPDV
jgi:hypothetical protein